MLCRFAFLSGMVGLTGIPFVQQHSQDLYFVRPLLSFKKSQLMATCIAHGQKWVEDPSNVHDDHRGKVRSALSKWKEHGVTIEQLGNVLQHVTLLRNIMVNNIHSFIQRNVKFDSILGFAAINKRHFFMLDSDTATRVLICILQFVLNKYDSEFRYKDVKKSVKFMATNTNTTVGNCIVNIQNNTIYVTRSPPSVAKGHVVKLSYGETCVWDKRFEISLEQYNKWSTENDHQRAVQLSLQEPLLLQQARFNRSFVFNNTRIPEYKGKVDTNPNSKLTIRFFRNEDWQLLTSKNRNLKFSVLKLSQQLKDTMPVIEDENGILAVPFMSFKRQRDIYWKIKFLSPKEPSLLFTQPMEQQFL